jgi:hypothetical protein
MKFIVAALTFVSGLVLGIAACSLWISDHFSRVAPSSTVAINQQSPTSVPTEQEQRALRGDAKYSAQIVMDHPDCFRLPNGDKRNECEKNEDYWINIDAENGGTLGVSIKLGRMATSENCFELNRALFYLSDVNRDNYEPDLMKKQADRISLRLNNCKDTLPIPSTLK